MHTPTEAPEPPPGCPAHAGGPLVRLYGDDFEANRHAHYDYLRRFGPIAPVEIAPGVAASLVTSYQMALQVLQNPSVFVRDARLWRALNEGRVPADSPVVPMMAYRPNALFSDGAEHMRLRRAVTDSLQRIDTRGLQRHVQTVATYLIDQFSERGSANLVGDYAQQLPLLVFNELFGCPADIGDRIVVGISGIFEGSDAEKANEILGTALFELIALKRQSPGEDVTSWLMQHEARLSDEEMIHQLVTLLAAGTEPLQNLISSTLFQIFTDEELLSSRSSSGALVEQALYKVFWTRSPIDNYAVHYLKEPTTIAGSPIPAGHPIVIGFGAANTDPELAGGLGMSRKAHLAFGAGPHVCPAKDPATLISLLSVEALLNRLPDLKLNAVPDQLVWRPGMFHQSLAELPTLFSPQPVQARRPAAASGAVTARPAAANQPAPKRSRWSAFLDWLTG